MVFTRHGFRALLNESLSDTDQAHTFEAGHHRLRCPVPPILAPGEYVVGMWLGTQYDEFQHNGSVLTFLVDGDDGNRTPRLLRLEEPWDVLSGAPPSSPSTRELERRAGARRHAPAAATPLQPVRKNRRRYGHAGVTAAVAEPEHPVLEGAGATCAIGSSCCDPDSESRLTRYVVRGSSVTTTEPPRLVATYVRWSSMTEGPGGHASHPVATPACGTSRRTEAACGPRRGPSVA